MNPGRDPSSGGVTRNRPAARPHRSPAAAGPRLDLLGRQIDRTSCGRRAAAHHLELGPQVGDQLRLLRPRRSSSTGRGPCRAPGRARRPSPASAPGPSSSPSSRAVIALLPSSSHELVHLLRRHVGGGGEAQVRRIEGRPVLEPPYARVVRQPWPAPPSAPRSGARARAARLVRVDALPPARPTPRPAPPPPVRASPATRPAPTCPPGRSARRPGRASCPAGKSGGGTPWPTCPAGTSRCSRPAPSPRRPAARGR